MEKPNFTEINFTGLPIDNEAAKKIARWIAISEQQAKDSKKESTTPFTIILTANKVSNIHIIARALKKAATKDLKVHLKIDKENECFLASSFITEREYLKNKMQFIANSHKLTPY